MNFPPGYYFQWLNNILLIMVIMFSLSYFIFEPANSVIFSNSWIFSCRFTVMNHWFGRFDWDKGVPAVGLGSAVDKWLQCWKCHHKFVSVKASALLIASPNRSASTSETMAVILSWIMVVFALTLLFTSNASVLFHMTRCEMHIGFGK